MIILEKQKKKKKIYLGWNRKQRSTHLPIEYRRRKIGYASTKEPRDCSSRLSMELAGSVLLAPITWKLRSIVSWQATLVRARDFIVSPIEARFIQRWISIMELTLPFVYGASVRARDAIVKIYLANRGKFGEKILWILLQIAGDLQLNWNW